MKALPGCTMVQEGPVQSKEAYKKKRVLKEFFLKKMFYPNQQVSLILDPDPEVQEESKIEQILLEPLGNSDTSHLQRTHTSFLSIQPPGRLSQVPSLLLLHPGH